MAKDFDKGFNWDKLSQDRKVVNNGVKYSVEKQISEDKYLKQLDRNRRFDKNIYDKGVEFFNLGGKLDEAIDKYRDNDSFISGYQHAKRLAYISQMDNKKSR